MAADGVRLQQVVWNVLSNAITFTPKGGHVWLRAFRREEGVTIEVRDDGEGISAEFLPHIFDAFTQADGSLTRRYGGLGLGLAIVKQLVQAHGGTVTVESPGVGLGSTFRIELPARPMVPPSSPVLPQADVRLDGVTVLVVDDDADSSALLEHLLTVRGGKVTVAPSSRAGLRALDESRYDVILSDIAMPDIDGFGFIRSVRGLPKERGGETPVVAVTANARDGFSKTAAAAGFAAHLPKPIDVGKLVRVVAQISRLQQPHQTG
jgi:CheY-like chemotaxis protein